MRAIIFIQEITECLLCPDTMLVETKMESQSFVSTCIYYSKNFQSNQLLGISHSEKVKHSNIPMLLTVSANIRSNIISGK